MLGAGGVARPEIRAGSRGCWWQWGCLVPHHVAPKATWSCQNRVPPCFLGELGASAARPAPKCHAWCKTLQGRTWLSQDKRAFIPILQVLVQTGCCGHYLQWQVSVRKVETPG